MERVLVVPTNRLFQEGYFQGFKSAKDFKIDFVELMNNYSMFLFRKLAEKEPKFKQVIPYIVFKFHNEFFIFRRLGAGGEPRLHNRFSLGIGGHISSLDGSNKGAKVIHEAIRREFEEELYYAGSFAPQLVGFINDDSNEVGKVHFGMVFLVEGTSPHIKVRETSNLSGRLVTFEHLAKFEPQMESWSKIIYQHLKRMKEKVN